VSQDTSNVSILRIFSLFTKAMSDHTLKTVFRLGHHIYKKTSSYCLESVQRAATRLVREFRDVPYEDRLRILGLTTLAVRIERGDLIECYQILSGKENLYPYQIFQRSDTTHL